MSKKEIALGINGVICQKWEEVESGWGERPDGFSLHLTLEALTAYIQQHWCNMSEPLPDEYSRPDGTPYPVGVNDEVYAQIAVAGYLRFYDDYQYPGTAGIDGWQPHRVD